MSSGAKQILYVAKETVAGTTPNPLTLITLPFVSTSLDANTNITESDTIRDSRMSSGGQVTAMNVSGDIVANMAYGTYDDLLAAAFFGKWVANKLQIGEIRQTFTAVRGFKDAGGYHYFRGLHVSQFGLEIPEEGSIKGTWTFAGLDRSQSPAAPTATITPASTAEEFSNVGVGEIELDGASLKGIACVTSFKFDLNNNLKVQKCLGDGLAVGKQIETKVDISGSFVAAFGDKAAEIYEKQFTNGKLKLKIPFGDGDNNYILTIPRLTVTGSLPSGSSTDLLQITFNFKAEVESPYITRVPKAVGP